ncbi:MAG: argininosuccinate lyase [Planctomycetaceae bacterium]|nr:argininosuccinate lyase [Planctomycetaceae bacterium]
MSSGTGLWGGRFAEAPNEVFLRFQESLSVDARMWREDLAGSMAWARALADAGVITDEEAGRLQEALEAIGGELEGDEARIARSEAEDVHSFVEAALVAKVGALGKKLHTGRSRNDQVATDLKLHLRGLVHRMDEAARDLQLALVELADRTADLPLPGYTHLQRAQPITAGHHALAYVEMLARDRSRLADAEERMDTCPLGSGALAGTAFPIDREALAEDLGFGGGATRNSLDAVSDRDHALELTFVASTVMLHLSRLAEDWIFLASQEAGLIELSDAVCTGSSLMPQKKNPDALELVRGRAGRVFGNLQALLVLQKGTPLAYNRDFQEDKRLLFDALDSAIDCLVVTALVVRGVQHRKAACRRAAAASYQNATDVADLLVAAGVPFRDAHERAGLAVRRALELGVELEAMPAAELEKHLPELGSDLSEQLSVDAVLARRDAIGGTAPGRVRDEAAQWRAALHDETQDPLE